MRTLFLFRHAKSSWDNLALEDFDRPLARRGEKAAPMMGRAMKERGWLPELALVSSARRAVETWQLAVAELPAEPETRFLHTLYHAPPERLLEASRDAPEGCKSLILVGHNPGLEDLARMLAGPGSDGEAVAALREKFPTAALARFSFDAAWAELRTAKLTHFLRPKELE